MLSSLYEHSNGHCSCLLCAAGGTLSDAGRALSLLSTRVARKMAPPQEPPSELSTQELSRKPLAQPSLKARPSVALAAEPAVFNSQPYDVPRSASSLSSSPPSLSPPSQFSGALSPRSLLFRAGAEEGSPCVSFLSQLPTSVATPPRPRVLTLRADGPDGKHVATEDTNSMTGSLVLQPRTAPSLRRSRSESSLAGRYLSAGLSPPSDSSLPTPVESPQGSPAPPREDAVPAAPLSYSRSFLNHDLSAYVSGIGDPVDPDTELSSVVQLQAFRMQSRSRSVGPGYQRSPRMYQHLDGERSRSRKHYTLASPPHPPLFNHDTLDIEPLPPAVAPAPTAQSPEPQPELARSPPPSKSVDGTMEVDSAGFRKVRSRHHRRRQRASRPRAEEPEPLDMSAFADREHEESDEEERGRGRSRSRQYPERCRSVVVDAAHVRNGLPPNALISESPLKAKPVGAHRLRISGMTFAEAAAQEGRDARGRQEKVKPVTSSARADSVDASLEQGDASALTRTRLLSNGSHLLMLSLELAMMRSKKISAPLRPRWGKRREDDFCPMSSPLATPLEAGDVPSAHGSPLRQCQGA